MTVKTTGTLIPAHPSNRRVVEQMVAWGWEIIKQDGRWCTMEAPPMGFGKTQTILVRPATQHDANPTSTFREIYRLTTQGNAELFWAGPGEPEAWADMVKQARLRDKKKRNEQANLTVKKAEERNKRIRDAEEAEKPKPMKEEAVASLLKTLVRSQQVYEVLVDNDRPMTVKAIAKALHMSDDDLRTVRDISNRCGYLVNRGLAIRMMEGTYRAAAASHAISARISHDVSSVPTPDPPRAVAAVVETPSPQPPTAAEPVTAHVESLDDTIEAVLDLLLPDGFRAADIRTIEAWVATTKAMIEAVKR